MLTENKPVVSLNNANCYKKMRYESSNISPEYNQNKKAHIIYCIDNSGSMKTEFRSQESFQCVIDMMTDQYHGDSMLSQCQLYSMLSFNTNTMLHFEKCLLSQYLISDVNKIKNTIRPQHGTDFSRAFQKIEEIVSKDREQDPWTSFTYFVIFLSDGRPGDLPWPVSPIGLEPMKTKSHRVIFPSAIHHLRNLTRTLSDRMNLFTIGIGREEETQWLERLVYIAKSEGSYGRFLLPRNIRNNAVGGLGRTIPAPVPQQQQQELQTSPFSSLNPNSKPFYPMDPMSSTSTSLDAFGIPQTSSLPSISSAATTSASTTAPASSDISAIKIEEDSSRISNSKKRSIDELLDSLVSSYPSLFDDPRAITATATATGAGATDTGTSPAALPLPLPPSTPLLDSLVSSCPFLFDDPRTSSLPSYAYSGTAAAAGISGHHSNQVAIKEESSDRRDFVFQPPSQPSVRLSMNPPFSQPNSYSQPSSQSSMKPPFSQPNNYSQPSSQSSMKPPFSQPNNLSQPSSQSSMKPPFSQPNNLSQPSSQNSNIMNCYSRYLQGSTSSSSSHINNDNNNNIGCSTQMLPPSFVRHPVTLTPFSSNANNISTSGTNTATLQDAFRSISSQLTQTLTLTLSQDTGGPPRLPTPLRDLTLEQASTTSSEATERSFEATKMYLNLKNRGLPVFEAEEGVYRIVQLRNRPFAQGGQRYAYHLFDHTDSTASSSSISSYLSGRTPVSHFVAKESKLQEHYHDRLKFHLPMVQAQTISAQLAVQFNALLRRLGKEDYREAELQSMMISFLPCFVYRIRDERVSGQFRYLATEPYLEQTFVKYNGNDGYVRASPQGMFRDVPNMVAQAFSHWTYEHTQPRELERKPSSSPSTPPSGYEGRLLVCDIQGTGSTYTDPSICTSGKGGVFGKSDLGRKGWERFFSSHNCNSICSLLHLNSLCTGTED